jgi:CubicO group peptidase (beta-lactamase class C family)
MSMTNLNRWRVLAALGAGAINAPQAFAQASPQAIGERLTQALRDGRVSGLHALLVSQGSTLVFEHYGSGEYQSFAPDVLHDLRSVTKSVVVLVYGIALAAKSRSRTRRAL